MSVDMIEPQSQMTTPKSKHSFWMWGAIVLTGLLWGLAVALPVWDTRSNQTGDWDMVYGFLPALIGWAGLFAVCPAWFANLLLIPLCILFFRGRKAGFYLSLVALALAASAYTLPGVYGDNDEAVIEARRIGYYLWLGAFVNIALAHAILTPATVRKWIVVRVAVVAVMLLGLISLEKIYPVGVNPLETALKDPNDLTRFSAVLASHPSQADKDKTLYWAMRQDLTADRAVPSQQIVLLLGAGANPNQTNNGYVPILQALGRSKSSLGLVGLLVKAGADVNVRDEDGKTVLMWAIPPYGTEALAELLVKAGADVNAKDKDGKTVLDIAKENDSGPECVKFLVSAGARSGGH
jgi:Ankyrin repeats (many copies)